MATAKGAWGASPYAPRATHIHPRDLQPGQSVDGFRIIRRLDQGSVGFVFEVERAGQRYALKFGSPRDARPYASPAMDPFNRELMCLLLLHHRNIISVRGSSAWPDPYTGYRYMLLELAGGYTLDRWAEQMHPTPHQLAAVIDKLCSALEYMHGRTIFHRNLNARNIVVNTSTHEPVLIDFSFGDAERMEHLRNEPLPPGFPRYPSPEAVRFWEQHRYGPYARYVFRETDEIYALGACLYDVLTHGTPADTGERAAWGRAGHALASPLELTQGRVPPSLSDFTMKLIAPSPEDRPAHAGEVRRMLADLKKREGAMWHTPFYPAPPREPPAPPFRARVRAALVRAASRFKWKGLWPR